MVFPHLGVAPPLEVFPPLISLELEVTHLWDLRKVAGVWALCLISVIQIQNFVLVRPALFWSVLVVQLVGSVVDYLSVSIPV